MSAAALRIAIVGAESTGKTTLAAALAPRLAQESGRRVAWVPELLREWCEREGRTPQAHEQAGILRGQHERIEAAAARHDLVVCDTTALMTAVYSRLVFGDRTLEAEAAELHRGMALTLLMAVDLPWVADGHQRDGEHVREPVDGLLRELLAAHGLPFVVVGGQGPQRLQAALRAALHLVPAPAAGDRSPGRAGLFTGLLDGTPGARPPHAWVCECCVPELERALMRGG